VTTFAIVHAAGDTGGSWERVAQHLRLLGHEVVAPDLPAEDPDAGLAEYTDVMVEAIGDRRDVVLVGHSLGGLTAPLVCARVPTRLLVYLTAMVPRPGEKGGDFWTNAGYVGGEGTEEEIFYNDLTPEQIAFARAHGRDQSGGPLRDPWPLPMHPDTPTRYLLCLDDRFHTPDFVRKMVRDRLGIEPDEIRGGHCVNISRPKDLAEKLDAMARD
jgi:pimeloyl-ACP methyl ester carboxylesterase